MRWPIDFDLQRNTTLVNPDGSVEPGSFLLKHETQSACAIYKGGSEVLITGGDFTMDKVSVYAMNNWVTGEVGWSYDMQYGLQVGRASHACTSFISDEKMVSSIYLLLKF